MKSRRRAKRKLYNHFIPVRQRNKYHRLPPPSCSCGSLRICVQVVGLRGRRERERRVGEQKHTFKTIIEFDDNICPPQFYIIYFRYIRMYTLVGMDGGGSANDGHDIKSRTSREPLEFFITSSPLAPASNKIFLITFLFSAFLPRSIFPSNTKKRH